MLSGQALVILISKVESEANTTSFQALACQLARRPSMSQLAAIIAQILGADSAWLGIEVASGQLIPVTSYGIALPAVVIPGQCPASLGRESFSLGFTDPTGVIAVNFSKTRLADDHEIFQALEAAGSYAASLVKLNAQNAYILALHEIPKALLSAFSPSEACQIVIGVVLGCTGTRAGSIVSADPQDPWSELSPSTSYSLSLLEAARAQGELAVYPWLDDADGGLVVLSLPGFSLLFDTFGSGQTFSLEDLGFFQGTLPPLSATLNRLSTRGQDQVQRAETLADFSARLEAQDDPAEVIRTTARQLVQLTSFETALIIRIETVAGRDTIMDLEHAGPVPAELLREVVPGSPFLLEGARTWADRVAQPVFVPNYSNWPQAVPRHVALGILAVAQVMVTNAQAKLLVVLMSFSQAHPTDPTAILRFVAGRLENSLERAAGVSRIQAARFQAELEAKRFRILAELSAKLEDLESPHQIAALVGNALIQLTPFDGGVMYRNHTDGTLNPETIFGDFPPALVTSLSTYQPPQDSPLTAQLWLGPGDPAWIEDYFALRPLPLNRHGIRSVASIPIFTRGKLYGSFYLASLNDTVRRSREIDDLLKTVAGRIEKALERSRSLQEIRSTREEALRVMGLALELRDVETAGHTDRVTRLALELGQMVGLSESELEALRWGSYLHDTGKIAIPDSILFKPGRLTDEEIALMQTHTLRGEAMLRELGFLPEPVLELVRHHHENWDGQGYPDRLGREQIPLLARIFSLADVYDALTNIRPYKPAWTHEQTCANIIGESGRKFDPALTSLFLELIRNHGS